MRTHRMYAGVSKEIERVKAGHELIGEYVVVVTSSMEKARANWWCGRANALVERRGEDPLTFRVERDGFNYYVTRKLFVGDQVEFIGQDMI